MYTKSDLLRSKWFGSFLLRRSFVHPERTVRLENVHCGVFVDSFGVKFDEAEILHKPPAPNWSTECPPSVVGRPFWEATVNPLSGKMMLGTGVNSRPLRTAAASTSKRSAKVLSSFPWKRKRTVAWFSTISQAADHTSDWKTLAGKVEVEEKKSNFHPPYGGSKLH